MFRIRYYDQLIHPDHFKIGLLGRVIKTLNWCRWKLEVGIQGLVLRYLAKEGSLPEERVGVVTKMFRMDVQAEKLEMARTSPLLPDMTNVEVPRADRYVEGGLAQTFVVAEAKEKGLPIRPLPSQDLIARYMDPKRSKYAKGRGYTLVADENDFEPVITEK